MPRSARSRPGTSKRPQQARSSPFAKVCLLELQVPRHSGPGRWTPLPALAWRRERPARGQRRSGRPYRSCKQVIVLTHVCDFLFFVGIAKGLLACDAVATARWRIGRGRSISRCGTWVESLRAGEDRIPGKPCGFAGRGRPSGQFTVETETAATEATNRRASFTPMKNRRLSEKGGRPMIRSRVCSPCPFLPIFQGLRQGISRHAGRTTELRTG